MHSFFEDPTWSMTPDEMERAHQAAQARAALLDQDDTKAINANAGGPRTPEGKAISSQNARKHGFAASNPVISNTEEQEAWDAHLASYIERFQPADQVESDTVRRAALAMWKIDRISAIEAAIFNITFFYHRTMFDARLAHDIDPIDRMAIAFHESAGNHAFDLCRRYLHSATREHDHAIRTFYLLESRRKAAAAAAPLPATEAPQAAQHADPTPPSAAEKAREPNELPRKPAAAAPVVDIHTKSESLPALKTSIHPAKPAKMA